ncbi:hypothetical protein CBS76997_10247 [Aspergillus niger]|nr:hypothetical protein CBS13152_9395 [Aspergillus niger]KAI3036152.1 hypothetical protein CBS76997_10247 [Aspergillus niger]
MRAVNRALDEWKEDGGSREDVTRSLVELINVVWPVLQTSAPGMLDPMNIRQIVQYVASLLRPHNENDSSPSRSTASTSNHYASIPAPERLSSMGEDGVKDPTTGIDSSLDRMGRLQSGPAETDGLDMTISPSHLAAIFPEDFLVDMPNNNLDLVSQGLVPEGSEFQDIGILMAMVDDMEDTGLNLFTPEYADGFWLLWVTRRRTEWMDAQESVPADHRLRLAREVLHDFKAVQSSSGLLQLGLPGNLPTPDGTSISLEAFWREFGEYHGFRTTLWDKIGEITARKDRNQMSIGIDRASELMQLAINIGSPDVLISL